MTKIHSLSPSRRAVLQGMAAAGAAGLVPLPGRAAGGRVIVGTWGGDYQNLQQKHIVTPIMEKEGIQVIFATDNDSPRKTKLLAEQRLPRGSMDVVALNGSGMYEMYKKGTLLELDFSKLKNAKHILPKLRTKYSVPHIFTDRVILYNPSKITEAPTSYNDLWNPKYAGKIGVIDIQYQTTIESAALINGGSLHNYEPGKPKLLELKKMGVKIVPTNEAMAQALKSEEIWMCIMWKARGVQWQNAGVPIKMASPKEGLVLFISEFGIAKNAPDKDAAYAYLDATLDPRPQQGFIEDMGYNPTVDDVKPEGEMAKRVAFSPAEAESMMVQDYDYLAKNDAQLKEWWDKVFKA
ncbi:MAG TPA: ABC transporter substrate-binding protein [Stellaceae bacterium]|nr:ABC transporter substrate-binding protein [Stellaceae bacterium]